MSSALRSKSLALARKLHNALCSPIHTGALAGGAEELTRWELFSTVCPPEKLLKQLTFRSALVHRAKAPVLMRHPGRVKYPAWETW